MHTPLRTHKRSLEWRARRLDPGSSARRMSPFLLLLLLAAACRAAVPGDEVTSLPGWSGPLPSRIYSGHIPAGSDVQDGTHYSMFMWYMFVEAVGVADPTTAPLILFSNGGPGASSAYGLFTEVRHRGPLKLPFYASLSLPLLGSAVCGLLAVSLIRFSVFLRVRVAVLCVCPRAAGPILHELHLADD